MTKTSVGRNVKAIKFGMDNGFTVLITIIGDSTNTAHTVHGVLSNDLPMIAMDGVGITVDNYEIATVTFA